MHLELLKLEKLYKVVQNANYVKAKFTVTTDDKYVCIFMTKINLIRLVKPVKIAITKQMHAQGHSRTLRQLIINNLFHD